MDIEFGPYQFYNLPKHVFSIYVFKKHISYGLLMNICFGTNNVN